MEKARYLFDAYDTEKTGVITRETFYLFLYELGKKETIKNQFSRCFDMVNSSKSGKLNYEEFSAGLPELYKRDFVPWQIRNHKRIDPEQSPHYYLFRQVVEKDIEDFANPDEDSDEEEEEEDDIDDDADSPEQQRGDTVDRPVASTSGRKSKPKHVDPITMARNSLKPSGQLSESRSGMFDASASELRKSINDLKSVEDLGDSPTNKRHAKIDDTSLSPSLTRAKFQEAATTSPRVPRPSNTSPDRVRALPKPDGSTENLKVGAPGAVYVSGQSPSAKTPYRGNDRGLSPPSKHQGGASPNTAAAAPKKKEVVMPPPLATAARGVKKTGPAAPTNFAAPTNMTTLPREQQKKGSEASPVAPPKKKHEVQITGLKKASNLSESAKKAPTPLMDLTKIPNKKAPEPEAAPAPAPVTMHRPVQTTALPRNAAEARAAKKTLARPGAAQDDVVRATDVPNPGSSSPRSQRLRAQLDTGDEDEDKPPIDFQKNLKAVEKNENSDDDDDD